jgi:hypothetical protein
MAKDLPFDQRRSVQGAALSWQNQLRTRAPRRRPSCPKPPAGGRHTKPCATQSRQSELAAVDADPGSAALLSHFERAGQQLNYCKPMTSTVYY